MSLAPGWESIENLPPVSTTEEFESTMTVAEKTDLASYCRTVAGRAKNASASLERPAKRGPFMPVAEVG